MKMLTKIWGTTLLAILLMAIAPAKSSAQDGGQYISTQEFYDELSPYGTWVYDAKYGDVWIPDVDQDFRPYVTNGHWVYTSYGNTWVSDYDWGWATFHYGRWTYDDYYGWEWVPGSEWAPAWVDWKDGDGYYGWAPSTPYAGYDVAYGDNYYNDYSVPDTYWSFAPYAYINYPNVYNYCVPYARVHTIYGRSNFIRNTYNYNNRVYITGPRREDIQRHSNRPVRLYTINNVDKPARNTFNRNSVNFYRPDVRRDRGARPSTVIDGAAYRRENPNQRISGNDRRAGVITQRENAGKLASEARSNNSRFIRTNNNRTGIVNPAVNNNQPQPNNQNGQQAGSNGRFNRRPGDAGNAVQPGQQVTGDRPARRPVDLNNQGQQAEQQRQAREQQRQQIQVQRDQQSQQQRQQQTEQQRQQAEQVRQQRPQPQTDQQRQQQEQQRQQQTEQQRQQAEQVRQQQRQQQTDQQRQQQEQQRQQQTEQQRQQAEQVRQQRPQPQTDQQRQQQEQQRQQQTEQQRQQAEQVRQQQRQQQTEQRQQQTDQQRQQQEQQRQQQTEQQRQARDQQRQQQEQQRQQQREQQRQKQEQQKQQPQPPAQQAPRP